MQVHLALSISSIIVFLYISSVSGYQNSRYVEYRTRDTTLFQDYQNIPIYNRLNEKNKICWYCPPTKKFVIGRPRDLLLIPKYRPITVLETDDNLLDLNSDLEDTDALWYDTLYSGSDSHKQKDDGKNKSKSKHDDDKHDDDKHEHDKHGHDKHEHDKHEHDKHNDDEHDDDKHEHDKHDHDKHDDDEHDDEKHEHDKHDKFPDNHDDDEKKKSKSKHNYDHHDPDKHDKFPDNKKDAHDSDKHDSLELDNSGSEVHDDYYDLIDNLLEPEKPSKEKPEKKHDSLKLDNGSEMHDDYYDLIDNLLKPENPSKEKPEKKSNPSPNNSPAQAIATADASVSQTDAANPPPGPGYNHFSPGSPNRFPNAWNRNNISPIGPNGIAGPRQNDRRPGHFGPPRPGFHQPPFLFP